MTPIYVVMPVMAGPEMTETAISDCLAQTEPTRVLMINQGVDDAFRSRLERLSEADDRILCWHHEPSLLSLAASWNRALDFVWEAGGTEALVVNNDVRLAIYTVEVLQAVLHNEHALFVTAVGVTQEQFHPTEPQHDVSITSRGGPDFSCFLISRECHDKYRFDESFIPAYLEDLDTHRRMMLGGDGDRIFSVPLPYLHLASGTLKNLDPVKRAALERRIEQGSRTYYRRKWGGNCNEERFTIPFDPTSAQDGVTTPELQRAIVDRGTARVADGGVGSTAIQG